MKRKFTTARDGQLFVSVELYPFLCFRKRNKRSRKIKKYEELLIALLKILMNTLKVLLVNLKLFLNFQMNCAINNERFLVVGSEYARPRAI